MRLLVHTKENIKNHIETNHLEAGDSLIHVFQAYESMLIIDFIIKKTRYIGCSEKGMYIQRTHFMSSEFASIDFIPYSAIASIRFFGNGIIARKLAINLENGKTLKYEAMIRGAARIAKLTPEIVDYLIVKTKPIDNLPHQ